MVKNSFQVLIEARRKMIEERRVFPELDNSTFEENCRNLEKLVAKNNYPLFYEDDRFVLRRYDNKPNDDKFFVVGFTVDNYYYAVTDKNWQIRHRIFVSQKEFFINKLEFFFCKKEHELPNFTISNEFLFNNNSYLKNRYFFHLYFSHVSDNIGAYFDDSWKKENVFSIIEDCLTIEVPKYRDIWAFHDILSVEKLKKNTYYVRGTCIKIKRSLLKKIWYYLKDKNII